MDIDVSTEAGIERSIEEGERHLERIAKRMTHTQEGAAVVTDDYDWEAYLKLLKRTAEQLASTDRAVVVSVRNWRGDACHKLTDLGNDVRSLCVNALPMVERAEQGYYLIGHSFRMADGTRAGVLEGVPYTVVQAKPTPFIAVMLRACMRIRARLSDFYVEEWSRANEPRVRAAFEYAARFVRRVCRSKQFGLLLKNQERSAEKNRISCLNYVENIFRRNSKVLVLRVDLYVHPNHHKWSASARADWCINRYLRALREGRLIGPDVLGWIVKREGGFYRGIHFHLMVFLDGHKHRHGYVFSRDLGEAWKNRFSDGKGTYFNCWPLRKKYKYNALGVVHVTDRAMLMGIKKAVAYITKEDCALATGRKRNLRRGIRLRLADKPKRGAPRLPGNDSSVVKAVFFSG